MADVSHITRGGPWKAICNHLVKNPNSQCFLLSGTRMKFGNGEGTLFWHHPWVTEFPLKIRFPKLFALSALPLASVAAMGLWIDRVWTWNPPWSRELGVHDIIEWNSLLSLLKQVCLSPNSSDEMMWSPHKSGTFSVKSFYEELAKKKNESILNLVSKRIWKNLVPHRIEIFFWLALLEKINTKSKLALINIIPQSENVCPLCGCSTEEVDHLLIHCPFSQKLWAWWSELWNIRWVWPKTLELAFYQWYHPEKNNFFRKIWIASFIVIFWSIWKERNNRIFSNTKASISELQNLILLRICWWLKSWGEPFPYSAEEVIRNPYCLKWNGNRQTTSSIPKANIPWAAPPPSSLKWNVDASHNPTLHRSAIGGVLRNNQGDFLCIFSCPIPPWRSTLPK